MKKQIVFTAIIAVSLGVNAFAAVSDSAGLIFPALSIGTGARAAGMAEAFTAVSDDSSAGYWNPAGLAWITKNEIAVTYDKWFMDSYYSHALAAFGLPYGNLGIDIFYISFGAFDMVSESDTLTGGSITPYNFDGLVSYGIDVAAGLSAGISLKFAHQSVASSSSSGFAADLGIMYRTTIFSAGISGQNIGSAGAYSMPVSIKGGIAVKAVKSMTHNLLVSADCHYILKDAPVVCAGLEYTYSKMFALRAGYNYRMGQDNVTGFAGPAAGAGLNLGSVGFDYAFVPFGDLGFTHRVTLKYMFGGASPAPAAVKARPAAEQAAQPPVAAQPQVVALVQEKEIEPLLKDMFIAAGKLENSGKLDEAEVKYKTILNTDRSYADAWKRLGAVYVKQKKKADAVNCFETYIKLKPEDTAVKKWLEKNR